MRQTRAAEEDATILLYRLLPIQGKMSVSKQRSTSCMRKGKQQGNENTIRVAPNYCSHVGVIAPKLLEIRQKLFKKAIFRHFWQGWKMAGNSNWIWQMVPVMFNTLCRMHTPAAMMPKHKSRERVGYNLSSFMMHKYIESSDGVTSICGYFDGQK